MGKELKIDNVHHDICGDIDREIFVAPSVCKRTLSLWLLEAIDLVRRQERTIEIVLKHIKQD